MGRWRERKDSLRACVVGLGWSQVFLSGKGEVSVEQLCLGSLQSSDIGKVLISSISQK